MATPDSKSLPVLLTGAAGKLGTWLREHLAKRPGGVRSTDIRAFGPSIPGETISLGDLADASVVERLLEGTSAVVHFGAIAGEDTFERILQSNIVGTQNVLNAARRHGVKRIVYASSIHTVGFYPTFERIDADAPSRPDSYYAVSKLFGENLARLYTEKAGMDIACLRIGVVLREPQAPRNLWTWLSVPDLYRLVDACLDSPPFGFSITFGISNNRRTWWNNSKSAVQFLPRDDAERYARWIVPDGHNREPQDSGVKFHGGPFGAASVELSEIRRTLELAG
jgi:uronate dehydrogenase